MSTAHNPVRPCPCPQRCSAGSPADLRGAYHALARATLDAAKSKAKADGSPPAKRRKTAASSSRKAVASSTAEPAAYHYIGYVPAHGRVWELDGLRGAGALDVGALDACEGEGEDEDEDAGGGGRAGWMDAVRPALRRRMRAVRGGGHIQYSLLAVVEDAYPRASDALEALKRERAALERRLDAEFPPTPADPAGRGADRGGGWLDMVRRTPF